MINWAAFGFCSVFVLFVYWPLIQEEEEEEEEEDWFGLASLFNGISTFVGHLMSNLSY